MPLVVQLGASVRLPCSVDTPLPLHLLEVQWMREDSGTLVHLFQEGESRPESQSPAYSGKAQFFTEEIFKGNFSLLLRNVTTEDKGLYKCVVHTEHKSNETKVKIDIEWLVVTGADMTIFAYAGQDVILNCSVDTHVPLKELEVEWIKTNGEILVLLFSEGENRPESQHERFRGHAEFFSEEIPKGNFSLKLRDVKTEDKGEFMCKVHTDRESASATAWLQELGFSSLHIWILVLTIAAAVFAVLSSIPALWCIIEKDESKRALLLCCLQVSVPCILMSIAFAIWGKIESSVGEACACSIINLMRILMIFRVSPYIKLLSGTRYKRFTNLALPLENFVVTTGINSVVLLKYLTYHVQATVGKVVTGICYGIVLLYGLSTIVCLVFDCSCRVECAVINCSSVFLWLYWTTFGEILFLIYTHDAGFFSLGLYLGMILSSFGVHILYNCKFHLRRKRYRYLCHKVLVLCFILDISFSFQYLDLVSGKDKGVRKKEKGDLMCVGQRCQTQGQSPTSSQQMQDAEEMVPLSPPEQNTAHRQEETDDGLSEV